MEFRITDKKKKEIFISIFQLIKNASSHINLVINNSIFHIQGMDKSHICLFNLHINSVWFDYYQVDKEYLLCFDANNFHSMISTKGDDQGLVISINNADSETLSIQLKSIDDSKKGDYNKFFKLPLIEYEYEQMKIPPCDYDAEFNLPAKKVTDMLSQLSNFGDELNITCSQECVDFKVSGDAGEMRVNIPIDDMGSYAVIEDEEVKLSYSLTYIHKMCITNKLTANIDFNLSNESPMKINYNLGDDSSLTFYIAPKLADD